MKQATRPRYAEFFAGGGMVSAALAGGWDCAFANDIDAKKCLTYRTNFPDNPLLEGDVARLNPDVLEQPVDLYWASSPCQDFSLAGKGAGLAGKRSGVFEAWVTHLAFAVSAGFAPRIVAFENVTGLLSRNGGRDFERVMSAIIQCGYRVGAMEIDAADYLPHSRPRLFVVGVRDDIAVPNALSASSPEGLAFQSKRLRRAMEGLSPRTKKNLIWWNMRRPAQGRQELSDFIDLSDDDDWFSGAEVERLVGLMSPKHKQEITKLLSRSEEAIGFSYKRGRPDGYGGTRQFAEIRFDGVAGCIRTPAGGSSRQTVLFVKDGVLRARLLKPREATRLMGLGDDYVLPPKYNDGYRIAGDGVAVPIVKELDRQIFRPVLQLGGLKQAAA